MRKEEISKRIVEVHLIDEDGNVCGIITPQEYFFKNTKIKWYQRLFNYIFG